MKRATAIRVPLAAPQKQNVGLGGTSPKDWQLYYECFRQTNKLSDRPIFTTLHFMYLFVYILQVYIAVRKYNKTKNINYLSQRRGALYGVRVDYLSECRPSVLHKYLNLCLGT